MTPRLLPTCWHLAAPLLVAGLASLAGTAAAADAPLKEDRIRFIIHDDSAGQLSASQLGGYLEEVHDKLHGSQDPAIDVPTCTDLDTVTDGSAPPFLFTSNGGLASSLNVIENEAELVAVVEWGETQGDRVGIFVQDIQWCGAPVNAIGCAPSPGNVFVVAVDASPTVRGVVIAHERGHNAGLQHRTNDVCALMNGTAGSSHGCLNQAEASAFYNQADVNAGTTCECIDLRTMGPNQTWTLNPSGTVCDDDDVCTLATTCSSGLCAGGSPVACDDGDLCTLDSCVDPTGCSHPDAPNGTSCDDADPCNGDDFCISGTCTSFDPLVCDDALFCNGVESCIPATGCVAGTPPPTDDGVGCTDDSCDEVADQILNTPNDALCDNAAFCDGEETCDALSDCQLGVPPALDDGVACTDDACDEIGDVVVHTPNPLSCDDSDPCTADSCDEVIGCANDPIPQCTVEVAATRRWGRVLLGALIVVTGAWLLPSRPRRVP